MPDGRFVPIGSYESRAIAHRYAGVQENLDAHARAQWLRADEAFDTLDDVIGSLESIRGLSPELDSAKALLTDARAQIRGCAEVGVIG